MPSNPLVLASIGTVLIDIFDRPPAPNTDADHPSSSSSSSTTPQTTKDDSNEIKEYPILGGGALYALVGARVWLPQESLRTLIDRKTPSSNGDNGDAREEGEVEMTKEQEGILERFGKTSIINADANDLTVDARGTSLPLDIGEGSQGMWIFNEGLEKRMTRASIRYEGDLRIYKYISKPPLRQYSELLSSPLKGAEYLHIGPPFSPEALYSFIQEMNSYEDKPEEERSGRWRPQIVFEPTPPSCIPEQRQWVERCIPYISVFSPNHEELLSNHSQPLPSSTTPPEEIKALLEPIILHLADIGVGPNGDGIILIRCGRIGCAIWSRSLGKVEWYPPFFGSEDSQRVKDVTGAGNSFLGGFIAGLHITGDPREAVAYATVSASFVVEQFGLPQLHASTQMSSGEDGASVEERWNGDLPGRRLEKFKQRMAKEKT